MSTKKPLTPEQQKLVRAWNLLLEHAAKRELGWTTTGMFALSDEQFMTLIHNELALARKRHEEAAELRAENRYLRGLVLDAMRAGPLPKVLAETGGAR